MFDRYRWKDTNKIPTEKRRSKTKLFLFFVNDKPCETIAACSTRTDLPTNRNHRDRSRSISTALWKEKLNERKQIFSTFSTTKKITDWGFRVFRCSTCSSLLPWKYGVRASTEIPVVIITLPTSTKPRRERTRKTDRHIENTRPTTVKLFLNSPNQRKDFESERQRRT